ncbi:hypothetical protein [Mycolicibacterium hodleri]|uniref:hypothetical protein n=1 Tax=Mycolicibacterium hodleri TaxID=49897 RepID=UPI00112C927C|nr:hypothetical protein [Mycolicibacterium hodleri]
MTEEDVHMADGAWEATVVLYDQNDFGAPWAPSPYVVEQVRQLRADPAAMTRAGGAVVREVERRWAQVAGASDGCAHP